jgi:ferrous iron transport protein B
MGAVDSGLELRRQSPSDRVVALAGNPNVGKSTVFNALTGMNQHTGNWPGKTVSNAQGRCVWGGRSYILVDIPGTYSLMAHSQEEEVARNFICFGGADAVAVVCDATCLERNLNLVLQVTEITSRVVVCVNLLDEARRKHIRLNLPLLSQRLGVPVVGTVARKKKSLSSLLSALDRVTGDSAPAAPPVRYPPAIEQAAAMVEPSVRRLAGGRLNSRWLALRLLDRDESLERELRSYLGEEFSRDPELQEALAGARAFLAGQEIGPDRFRDLTVSALVSAAETLCRGAVTYEKSSYDAFDRRVDRILTSKLTGYPIMLALLALIFWITVSGANYPSQLLSRALFRLQDVLSAVFLRAGAPEWLHGLLVLGVYRVLAWVVSVMLPPMAIFFPLFTLLEDAGYLPRIAYNLDRPFKRCRACGKQALTM